MNTYQPTPCAVYHMGTLDAQCETYTTAFGSLALASWLQGRILAHRLWEIKLKH